MRISICILIATALMLRAAETDSQVDARKVALDLAGAFSNDGFKLRDGHWSGAIKKGEEAVVAVNLYAGNQYWFSVGTSPTVKKFAVQLFDESGQPVTTESYEDEEKAAAGFAPTISGQYFVAITPADGEASTYCLVYSYK
ncbi:MAG: hypothetical protein M3R10_00585 [Verrucomicrobiota bacterium]|nr:hypothetical protein [Verrucomicrobiota bacterium]